MPSTSIPANSNIGAQFSELVEDAKDPVVIFMPQGSRTHLSGTMRLGLRPTIFQNGVLLTDFTEDNLRFMSVIVIAMRLTRIISGASRNMDCNSSDESRDDHGERMEIFKLPIHTNQGPLHPYYVGVQYHPELEVYSVLSFDW
jgi:CTP synthase